MENIDKQRLRALEAKDLVHFFHEFNDGNSSRLDLLKNSTGWEGKAKAAKIVRRLNAIAKEIDLSVVEKVCFKRMWKLFEMDIGPNEHRKVF